jgi:hypothetical protein
VTVPRVYTSYQVERGAITGFTRNVMDQAFTGRATAPRSFSYPTFADPSGSKVLVRILGGRLAGQWVSPDDPGVRFAPRPP